MKILRKIKFTIPGIGSVSALLCAVMVQNAQAQIGSGWTQYYPSKQYNSGMSQSQRYSISGNVEHFWTYSTDTDEFPGNDSGPRSEWRVENNYTIGSQQFQGDLNPESGTTSYTCFQIFGSTTQATSIMLQMRSGNGTLRRYNSEILATGCWGIYTRVNVLHYPVSGGTGSIEVWINGSKVGTFADGGYTTHYFKYGVYNIASSAPNYNGDYWRGVSFFKDGNSNPPGDFSLSASPAGLTVVQGNSGTSTITETDINGFSGSVSLSASGLPSGVTASFSPNPTTSTSTLTLTAGSTAATGTATVTITGISGSLTHTTTVDLTVNPAPDFSLSASPSSVTVTQGSSGASSIAETDLNGFNGSVNLSASGLPSGVTASFSPNPTTSTSTLTLTASGTAATGTATVTITGISGSLTHTTTVDLTVNAASLPTGWTDVDLGNVGIAGNANYSSGTFTINASGADIWNTGDQFNYAYESVSGDQTVIARVVSENGTASFAKAGVMIRESLATNSVEASVLLTPTNGVAMEIRPTTGAASINVAGWTKGVAAPQWVKLVRSGNTFTAYYSGNGSTWTQIAATNVTMNSSATAGLAVTSHDNTSLNRATFDNVSISAGSGIDTTAVYQLQNEASGLVLNNQGSLTNGSAITQWSSVNSDNLRWTFIPTSNGYYQINSVKSGKDAVVQGASTAQGAGIIQYDFGSSGDDQWKPVQNSDGSYTFYNLHSGLVLEDPASSTSNTTQMDQWGAHDGSNQKWNLIKQ